MVNTRTDTDLSAAVQNALQALLPQIREEIREEFRTGSGSSNAGGNPPPVTIHTWLERFNKQNPQSFEKATAPMVNTRTITALTPAVRTAYQALLPGFPEEFREEFGTGLGPSKPGGNPTRVLIHTWLERFNKQKPNSFEKATVPVDAE
nr:zinc finger, CCHC-type, retrotransposon Gag domain protein [Tanacetum cinerariifolium]